MSEGRYEPSNFETFTIEASQLVWNWDTSSSNYAELKKAAFDASGGKSWLVEAGEPFSKYWFEDNLRWSAEFDPTNSGYGLDPMGPSALDECSADLDVLFSTIPDATLSVTRLHAELSRAALVTDLNLQASPDQSYVSRWFQVTNAVGTPPACPPPPDWCTNPTSSSSGSVPPVDTNPWDNHFGNGNGSTSQASGSCAVAPESTVPATFGLVASALFMSLARRRTRRSRTARSS
jgi:hypothetical protein